METHQIFPFAYYMDLPSTIPIHHTPLVSLLDRVADDPHVGQQVEPTQPVQVDGKKEYQVLGVEDSQVYRHSYSILFGGHDMIP